MDSIIRDVKYALRSVAASKKFAAIVIATLALGIGANTAVFGVLNAVVLRPLPYKEPARLVRVSPGNLERVLELLSERGFEVG